MDKNDWQMKKNIAITCIEEFREKSILKPLGFRKLNHSLEMDNDDLMHPEGLKG